MNNKYLNAIFINVATILFITLVFFGIVFYNDVQHKAEYAMINKAKLIKELSPNPDAPRFKRKKSYFVE